MDSNQRLGIVFRPRCERIDSLDFLSRNKFQSKRVRLWPLGGMTFTRGLDSLPRRIFPVSITRTQNSRGG